MTDNALIVAIKANLQSLPYKVTYNESVNMFLSSGYVSQAGNMYQEGVRRSQYFEFEYSIGHGWYTSFLNSIRLYIWDNDQRKCVGSRDFYSYLWSEEAVARNSIELLGEYLTSTCKTFRIAMPTGTQLKSISEQLFKETMATTKLLGHCA
jgi:hypothetical protein